MQIRKSGLAMPSAARYPRVQTRYDGKFWPMALMGGGAEGSHDTRDLLTADNFPIRDLFGQIDDLLRVVSENRQRVSQLFVEEVDNAYVRTYNQVGNILVQRGAEYGRPTAQRVSRASTVQGLPIEPFKMMTMWTREYLALQQAEWLRREAQAFVVADMELQWRIPLQTLFDNLASTTVALVDPGTNISLTVRAPLYNADGIVPPPFENVSFAGTHDHYFVSGTTAVSAGNVETLRKALDEHGHRTNRWLIVHDDQVDDIQALPNFVGVADPLTTVGPGSTADRANLPAGLPNDFEVIGVIKYTGFRVMRWNMIPTGYVVALDLNGPKPVARREWPAGNQLRGLQLIRPDADTTYPVNSVYYERWAGWGGNFDRSNGAIMQVKASGTYDVPSIAASIITEG
jgi:hypothetical protein